MDNLIFKYYLTDRIHYYIFAQNNQLCTMVKLKDGFTLGKEP